MPVTLTYSDKYLGPRITVDIEDRAIAEVANIGTFPDEWTDKLCVVRAYIICCLEFGGAADDTFAMKLAQYRKEFDFLLGQAKRAQAAVETDPSAIAPIFTMPLERA